jgi:hypothetical protein
VLAYPHGLGLGQGFDDLVVARHHEVGHPAGEELDQFGKVEVGPRSGNEEHLDLVVDVELAADRDAGRLGHGRVGHHVPFDLEGGDVLSPPAQRVLVAVVEGVVPVGVASEGVAGVEPAVAPGGHRRRRVADVPAGQFPRPVGPHDEFADLAAGHGHVVPVDDADLDAVAGNAARPGPQG